MNQNGNDENIKGRPLTKSNDADITATQIKESQELLQSVFNTSLIQMAVLKAVRDNQGIILDFKIILVNAELERETGRTDLVGKMYGKEYPGIYEVGIFDVMVRVVETGKAEKLDYFYAHEGFNKWFSTMFVKMDDGVVSTNLDISERTAAKQKELKNLTLLEKTEELAKSGSWEYDIATAHFWWSDGMYRLFELPVTIQVTPQIYLDYVIREDKHIAERLVRAITKSFEAFEEIIKLRVNDVVKILKIKSVTTYDRGGHATSVLGIDIDLSASFHAEEVIAIQNQKLFKSRELLRKKDEFINIASHELKTPVTSIKAYAEILQEEFETSKEKDGVSYLQKMNTQINRLTHLISNLLDTTRLSEGEINLFRDKFDISTLIHEKIEELQRLSRNHKLIFESTQSYMLFADRERIGQVLTNLIINAVKYSPKGGEILVTVADVNEWMEVSVRDQGIGIKRELLDKIFERFFRVEESADQTFPGLGLGLYISSGIIQRHGGRISVESEEGKGSVFTFTLPAFHP